MAERTRIVIEGRLTEGQIEALWEQYIAKGGERHRDDIITHYLPLVKYVVGRVASGLPRFIRIEDLYSTGIMGLMKAVDRYDNTMDNKFETYAILLIKGAIIDELRALDWIPRSVHQKVNMVENAQKELQQSHGREATTEEIAAHLDMDIKDLGKMLVRIRPSVMVSLDEVYADDDERAPLAERIPDTKAKTSFEDADRKEVSQYLAGAIEGLPEQERLVLSMYYYEGLMLKEIGSVLSVSESRVSQIHSKAIIRLRKRTKEILKEHL